jgi:hypothetical protein
MLSKSVARGSLWRLPCPVSSRRFMAFCRELGHSELSRPSGRESHCDAGGRSAAIEVWEQIKEQVESPPRALLATHQSIAVLAYKRLATEARVHSLSNPLEGFTVTVIQGRCREKRNGCTLSAVQARTWTSNRCCQSRGAKYPFLARLRCRSLFQSQASGHDTHSRSRHTLLYHRPGAIPSPPSEFFQIISEFLCYL